MADRCEAAACRLPGVGADYFRCFSSVSAPVFFLVLLIRRAVIKQTVRRFRLAVSADSKLLLFATLNCFMVLTRAVSAGDRETLTTLKGEQYEKVRITEITPATVTIVHSTCVCRIPIVEFPAEVRKRFGYDEAKAAAWVAEQTRQAAVAAQPVPLQRANRVREAEYVAALMRAGAIDPYSGRFYLPDPALQQRATAFELLQRYGTPRPMPQVSPASPAGAK